jgi:hypothetical protein
VLPLLKALYTEAYGRGLLMGKMPSIGSMSRKLRQHLQRAGVQRAALFEPDATRKAITWHDLRATSVTWCAARGDEPAAIMDRTRHDATRR